MLKHSQVKIFLIRFHAKIFNTPIIIYNFVLYIIRDIKIKLVYLTT